MVDFNLINSLDQDVSFETELAEALGTESINDDTIASVMGEMVAGFQSGMLLKGRIVGTVGDDVVIDVGLKSEGLIPVSEWDDRSSIDVGDEVDVWLYAGQQLVTISKSPTARIALRTIEDNLHSLPKQLVVFEDCYTDIHCHL